MNHLPLAPETRLMLIAPHPDDGALACGILLQRAVAAGAHIRVLYATDGDNNPWPQRALDRKWRLQARDRQRWGRLRRAEARAALRTLGVETTVAKFLGLPDQGLRRLLKQRPRETRALFQRAVLSEHPTLLLAPSIHDTHADHRTIGLIVRDLAEELGEDLPALQICTFAVHGRKQAFSRHAIAFRQTPEEAARKRASICCHRTQLVLSGRRFLAYADRPERLQTLSRSGLPRTAG